MERCCVPQVRAANTSSLRQRTREQGGGTYGVVPLKHYLHDAVAVKAAFFVSDLPAHQRQLVLRCRRASGGYGHHDVNKGIGFVRPCVRSEGQRHSSYSSIRSSGVSRLNDLPCVSQVRQNASSGPQPMSRRSSPPAIAESQRGPYAARPAYDDLIQGMCGIPWLSGQATGEKPRYAPMVLADRVIGLQLCNAIIGALFCRERAGIGQRVDVPMFEGMLSIVPGEHLAGRLYEPPIESAGYQRSLARDRRPYETSDGHICVLFYNDNHWRSFFEVIDRSEIFARDARFGSQGNRLFVVSSGRRRPSHAPRHLASALTSGIAGRWVSLDSRR